MLTGAGVFSSHFSSPCLLSMIFLVSEQVCTESTCILVTVRARASVCCHIAAGVDGLRQKKCQERATQKGGEHQVPESKFREWKCKAGTIQGSLYAHQGILGPVVGPCHGIRFFSEVQLFSTSNFVGRPYLGKCLFRKSSVLVFQPLCYGVYTRSCFSLKRPPTKRLGHPPPRSWIAVREFNLSSHNMDIQ